MQFNDFNAPLSSSLSLPYDQLISLLLLQQQQLESFQKQQSLLLIQQQHQQLLLLQQAQQPSQIPSFQNNNDITMLNPINFVQQQNLSIQQPTNINSNVQFQQYIELLQSKQNQRQSYQTPQFQNLLSNNTISPFQNLNYLIPAQPGYSVSNLSPVDSSQSSSTSHIQFSNIQKTKKIHKNKNQSKDKPTLNSSSSWNSQDNEKDSPSSPNKLKKTKISKGQIKDKNNSNNSNNNKLGRLQETKAQRWNFLKEFYDKQVLVKRVFIDLDEFIPSNEVFKLIKREEVDNSISTNSG